MSVYQRKSDNLWIVGWYEDRKKKTKAFKDEQTARAFEAERLTAQNKDSVQLTLGELTAAFFRSHPDFHHVTKDTIIWLLSGREDKGGNHSTGPGEFLRNKYAEALSRQDLERLREGFRVRGVSNSTINKYQAYLHAVLSWGDEQELIVRNPWRGYKHLPSRRKAIQTNLDDIRRVYLAAPPWLQWAIKTMYALTIRPGLVELFGLKWQSFDWRHGAVSVKQGKSGAIKTVYPPPIYLEEARARFEEDSAAGIEYVCHRNGKHVNSYRTAWQFALERAGLPHFRMYDIRHVAVSEALYRTGDLAAVAAQAGHSAVSTTSDFYAHAVAGAQKRAAALMPALDDLESVQFRYSEGAVKKEK